MLELATILAMRDPETIAVVGKLVSDALYNTVRNAANVHPLVLTRAIYYLLHLLNASQVSFVPAFAKLRMLMSCDRNIPLYALL